MSKQQARQAANEHRFNLSWRGYGRDGEYRVTLKEWPVFARSTEDKAYYTDDIEDAVLTGIRMRRDEPVG
jgi:hypothetical protein